ncbi:monovalent cation:H+ antiporter-2, CPA2 family [Methylococcus capsulatus]|uniref:Monovalent cation:H+ antiporter-2, CPA2 family n=1 Tax=Methylococcus capsulatus TaxID=414 RepID=A0AA35UN14_METCP|nr:cation:proton antiporter [Methylococcus capsulatus]CAI8882368.1 monovalent cation:H+ antiporter-2, CPA2 family [Methylococcus capsulatus]
MAEHLYPGFFSELLVLLLASLASVLLFQRLRLPDILAYLFAGGLVGPFGFGMVTNDANIHFLSELGLVFLMFELGLEFSVRQLLHLSRAVFGLGSLQMLLTLSVFASALFFALHWPIGATLVVAGSLALSSTALVVRELRSLKLINRHHAQLAVGVLIFQDLAALLGLILVPALAGNGERALHEQLLHVAEKGGILVVILTGAGKWLLPSIFHEVARSRSEEIFVLTVLVIILLSAWLTQAFGLSMALGAFLTGVMLGEGEFRHQVEVDIRPFKDILMGVFFASVGMQIDFGLLVEEGRIVLLGIVLLILAKSVVITLAARIMGESATTGSKTGIILAQASEFGLALITLGAQLGVLAPRIASLALAIVVGSLILAPWLIRYNFEISQWIGRLVGQKVSGRDREMSRIPPHLSDHIILAGYGRVGQMIAKFLKNNGIPFIALDPDGNRIKEGRAAGDPVIYGSCARIDLLRRCHMERARLAILTFKSLSEARRIITQIRRQGYTLPIVVRTQNEADHAELIAAGADYVIPEMLESSLVIAAEVLSLLGYSKTVVQPQIDAERALHAQIKESAAPDPGEG